MSLRVLPRCRVCDRLTNLNEWTSGLYYCSTQCQTNDFIFTLNMTQAIDKLRQNRHILYMDTNIQLAISRLKPTEIVEWETHETQAQFIRVEHGTLTVDIQKECTLTRQLIADELDTIIIPANTMHRLSNQHASTVSFYTIYTPPAHTLKEKENDDKLFHGQ